jgi:hypothetical protein
MGGLPLLLDFQYFILMIRRACDLKVDCDTFKLIGLQFHLKKQLKNGHSNFKDLLFCSQ